MDFKELFTTVENLEEELKNYDRDILVKLSSFLIRQYVMKNGIGYDEEIDDVDTGNKVSSPVKEIKTFSELIKEMQRKFNFPELQKFSIDRDKVYLSTEGKRLLVNVDEKNADETNKIPGIKTDPVLTNKQFSKNKKENTDFQNRFKSLEMDE